MVKKLISMQPMLHKTDKGILCSIVVALDTTFKKDDMTFCENSAISEILNKTVTSEFQETVYFHNAGCVQLMVQKKIVNDDLGSLEIFRT